MATGAVFRFTSWTHVSESNSRVTFNVRDKKTVAVMLHIGDESKDGSRPLNLLAAMKELGWKPTTREFEEALKKNGGWEIDQDQPVQ